MLGFLSRKRSSGGAGSFAVPVQSDGLVYAIGDIHGRVDLLERLLTRIGADLKQHDGPAELVFLGDYVDRGDDSRLVLDVMTELSGMSEARPVFLMGNHEQMLLEFLRDPDRGARWLRHGGLQTLMSYGVGTRGVQKDTDFEALRDALAEAMGAHVGFLERLSLTHRSGNVLFVHAAADPALPAGDQEQETLLWGCDSFMRTPRQDGVWVVHGHTVVSRPRTEQGRISIDTGAYYSGQLTAARIEGERLEFLTN